MRGRLLAACAPLIVMCLACGSGALPEDEPGGYNPAPAPRPPEPATAPGQHRRAHYSATFADNQLVACSEIVRTITPPTPEPEGWEPNFPEPAVEGTVLRQPCAQQFANRAPLAHCFMQNAVDRDDGAHAEVSIRSFFYGAGVLRSDSAMRSCLQTGGEWWAAASDSPEALEAELRDLERQQR